MLKSICDVINAELTLFYINTPHNFKTSAEVNDIISSFKSSIGDSPKVEIRNDHDVAQGILTFCKENNIDMAALVNHRKAVAAHYLMGITETMVFLADFPIISINAS